MFEAPIGFRTHPSGKVYPIFAPGKEDSRWQKTKVPMQLEFFLPPILSLIKLRGKKV
jgi:hypothetical protein